MHAPGPPLTARLAERLDRRLLPSAPWLALLTLSFASLASALYLGFSDASVQDYIAQNELAPAHRQALLLWLVVACGLAGLASLVLLTSSAWLTPERLEAGARLVCPAVLAYPVLLLCEYRYWVDHQLEFLLLLGACTLVAERLFQLTFKELGALLEPFASTLARLRERRVLRLAPLLLVLGAAIAYALFLGYFTIQEHHRIQTSGFDLGHYENVMFNALHGEFFRSTILWGSSGGNNLANHAELVMVLFLPFYALHPSGEAMLVIQAVMMGASVIPLFLLARSALGPLTALPLCFVYLIAGTFSSPLFYDFHWLPIAMPFHFLLMYALNTRRYRLAALAFLLALLVREDVALTLALGSTYFITSRRNVKLGLTLLTASLAWFFAVKFGLMRLAGNFDFGFMYSDLILPKEKGLGSVIKTVLTNPFFLLEKLLTREKLSFMLHLLVPLAFLPWRNWRWALFSCGGFATTLLTTNANYALLSPHFHYLMHWTPYLYAAAIVALHTLGRQGADGVVRRRAALAAVVFASVVHSVSFGPFFQRATFMGGFHRIPFEVSAADLQVAESMRLVKELIPDEASVAGSDLEIAQFSTRLNAFDSRFDVGSADFIVIDRHHLDPGTFANLDHTLTTEPYGLLFERDPVVLLKRGHRNPLTQITLKSMGLNYVDVGATTTKVTP